MQSNYNSLCEQFCSLNSYAPDQLRFTTSSESPKNRTRPATDDLKPTSHSTIFDIPMRPVRKDQRHRRRFTR